MIDKKDSKYKELIKYSNPKTVLKKAKSIYGDDVDLSISPRKDKKYRIYDFINNKYIDFGQMGYEDFTKHKDDERRYNYLQRSLNIKGNWKKNPFSANNLSIFLLW
jgi:hypothetical protein